MSEAAATVSAAKSRIRHVHDAIVAQADAAARILAETSHLAVTGHSDRVRVAVDGDGRLQAVSFTEAARGARPEELRADFLAALFGAHRDLEQQVAQICERIAPGAEVAAAVRHTLHRSVRAAQSIAQD